MFLNNDDDKEGSPEEDCKTEKDNKTETEDNNEMEDHFSNLNVWGRIQLDLSAYKLRK